MSVVPTRGQMCHRFTFLTTDTTTVETPQCIKRKGRDLRGFAGHVQYSLTYIFYSPFSHSYFEKI